MNYFFYFNYNKNMNQILFYKNRINKIIKSFYKNILCGIIVVGLIVILFMIKDKNIMKNNEIYSDVINTNIKLNQIYKLDLEKNDEKNDEILGRIVIEKINLDYIIFNDYSEELLKVSICKLLENKGNITLIGHNYDNGKFFSDINKLENDDKISIFMGNVEYKYIVYDKYEVFEEDVSPLEGNNIQEITLITCNNFNKMRLIIKAKKENKM